MSSNHELQQEELEVLKSIYDGDDHFKEISSNVFQYKVGDEGSVRTFLLELTWGDEYPEQLPAINLNTFYNKHLSESVKSIIEQSVREQAESLLGMAMTYTLFEYVKENVDEIFSRAPTAPATTSIDVITCNDSELPPSTTDYGSTTNKSKVKKEQLTKSQKRRLVNRQDINGEMQRGWNWVDVVKHLCQTGQGKQQEQQADSVTSSAS